MALINGWRISLSPGDISQLIYWPVKLMKNAEWLAVPRANYQQETSPILY